MKQLTFSTKYPSYHNRKGEATLFVEKIYKGLKAATGKGMTMYGGARLLQEHYRFNWDFFDITIGTSFKYHTIRSGHRWKVGDWFQPKIWTGRPYNSTPIPFCPPLQIKKIWTFELTPEGDYLLDGHKLTYRQLSIVAANDGLMLDDFELWFATKKNAFSGQILCWFETIDYDVFKKDKPKERFSLKQVTSQELQKRRNPAYKKLID